MGDDQDLQAMQTEGYKVGEKKTLDEYKNLDAEDESLNRWKESLGLGASGGNVIGDPSDPRKVVIQKLSLVVEGRPDVDMDLSQYKDLNAKTVITQAPFVIKEGAEYQVKVVFKIQHEVISGLKYLHVVKRKGIRVDKSQWMMGSYGPNTDKIPVYEKTFPIEEAPSGMLARGTYNVTTAFVDDDNVRHLEFSWNLEIKKDW